ncbi:Helo-like-N domain-containing protein [Fusarium falciforme]|uniref:Helo-like-N domain-containing protein n=1 Tax=Fusarium falciforme TaxID=195108 RepID=UPI00230158F3|nr:Helo-like-N domain-containing protein [Fusarium falciforme]WAO95562.1 Helo-like-N domain-containing protein [Fusarium falciforme]
MDPLSIIAGVAGIATAGVSLVEVLFDTIDSYQNAPKDIVSIARGVQDLSIILDQLKQVLIDGRNMHTRWLLKSVASAIRQIEYVHAEVWELIPRSGSGFERVKWTFRKGKIRDLLNKIETQKSTVQLVCTTLLLAIQQKKVTKHNRRRPGNDSEKYARSRLRRQAENLVKTAHESLLNLTQSSHEEEIEGSSNDTSQSQRQQEPQTPLIDGSPTTPTIRVSGPEQDFPNDNGDLMPQKTPDETALWVYDMVFLPTAERKAHEGDTGPRPDGSNALILRNSQGTDIVLASKRPMAAEVVDDLLYDWTHLSWHDIKETSETVRVEHPEQPRSQDGRCTVIEEPPRSIFDEAYVWNTRAKDPQAAQPGPSTGLISTVNHLTLNEKPQEGDIPLMIQSENRQLPQVDTGPDRIRMRVQNREGIHVMQLLRMTQMTPWMTWRENVPERGLHMKKPDAEQTPSLRSIVRTHNTHHDQTQIEVKIERQTIGQATERIIQVEPTRVKRQVGYRGLPLRVYLLERLKRFVSIKSQAAGTV